MPHPWLRLGSGVWVGLGRITVTVGVINGVYVVWCEKKYWYWYWQYFSTVVLVLVSASIVNHPATEWKYVETNDLDTTPSKGCASDAEVT